MAKQVKLSMQWLVSKTFDVRVPDGAEESDVERFADAHAERLLGLDVLDLYPVEITFDNERFLVVFADQDTEFDAYATDVEGLDG